MSMEAFDKHINTIICGDCLEVMRDWPDGCVDLCLTDFPYGVGVEYDTFDDTPENVKRLVKTVMPEILRVSNRTVLTCATRQICYYPDPSWILCWLNRAGAGMNPWGFTCWQPILVYGKDPYLQKCMGSRPDIIEHSEATVKLGHPCAKPIGFWTKLLKRTSVNTKDIIVDPFCGSGTTCVAAKMLGRRYIGIDISEEYCEIARQRLRAVETGVPVKEQKIGQGALFED